MKQKQGGERLSCVAIPVGLDAEPHAAPWHRYGSIAPYRGYRRLPHGVQRFVILILLPFLEDGDVLLLSHGNHGVPPFASAIASSSVGNGPLGSPSGRQPSKQGHQYQPASNTVNSLA